MGRKNELVYTKTEYITWKRNKIPFPNYSKVYDSKKMMQSATSAEEASIYIYIKKSLSKKNHFLQRKRVIIPAPSSPNLQAHDFLPWEHLKQRMYATKLTFLDKLKRRNTNEINPILKKILDRMMENIVKL